VQCFLEMRVPAIARALATALVCLVLGVTGAECQELPAYQMYLLHPAVINPAMIGSADCAEIHLLDRHQWIGAFKGAPKTQVFAAEKSFSSDGHRIHGLGLQVVNDANGAYKQLAVNLGYAFHIALNRSGSLKLGFALMPAVYQSTYDERDFSRINDPIVTWSVEREIRPDVSTGMYLQGDQFFIGLSAVQLFAFTSNLNTTRGNRGYFAHGGYDLQVSGELSLQPGLTLKYLSKQLQSDLNARVTYRESYWAMLSYRHRWHEIPGQPGNLLVYAGFHYKNILFGYGYDLGFTSMQKYGYGSHEFMVGYRLRPLRTPCRAYQ
jgi:type IX secretion system PorP/SprF family membrane protein